MLKELSSNYYRPKTPGKENKNFFIKKNYNDNLIKGLNDINSNIQNNCNNNYTNKNNFIFKSRPKSNLKQNFQQQQYNNTPSDIQNSLQNYFNQNQIYSSLTSNNTNKTIRPKTPKYSNNTTIKKNSNNNKYRNKQFSTENYYSNFEPKLRSVRKENTKTYFEAIDNNKKIDCERNYNEPLGLEMNNLENIINNIKENGFNRYQNEIEEKILIKKKLEKEIETLQKKINMYQNNKKDFIIDASKERIKIQNLLNVNSRYVSLNNDILKYQKDIPNIRPQIELIKNETIKVNNEILKEKNEIYMINDAIQKMNKLISDLKKEKDNFRPALLLLKKHAQALNQKIKTVDREKSDFMLKVTNLAEKKK